MTVQELINSLTEFANGNMDLPVVFVNKTENKYNEKLTVEPLFIKDDEAFVKPVGIMLDVSETQWHIGTKQTVTDKLKNKLEKEAKNKITKPKRASDL